MCIFEVINQDLCDYLEWPM